MPKAKGCTPCMSKSLKETIRDFTDDPLTLKTITEIADCDTGIILNLCSGKNKSGRQPSAYQSFISTCMKTKPIKGKPFGEAAKYMKECAIEYRKGQSQG